MFFSTCTYDVETPNTCFAEDVLPLFLTKCAYSGCHDANSSQSGYNFTHYEGILKGLEPGHPGRSKIVAQIRFNQMPPKGNPEITQLELSIIKSWIRQGAANSSNCVTCDSSFTWSGRVKPLLSKWCSTCHRSGNSQAGIDLSAYSGARSVALNGKLAGSIHHTSGYQPMPPAGKLSACDILAVQRWIDAGAKED